jgi:hypothetical protein
LGLWRQQQRDQLQLPTALRPPTAAAPLRPPKLAAIGKSVSLSPYVADDDDDDDGDTMDEDRRSCVGVVAHPGGRRLSRHHSVDMRDHNPGAVSGSGGDQQRPLSPLPIQLPLTQRLLLSSPTVVRSVRNSSMDIRPYVYEGAGEAAGTPGGGGSVRHYSMDLRGLQAVESVELSRRPRSLPDNFRTGTLSADPSARDDPMTFAFEFFLFCPVLNDFLLSGIRNLKNKLKGC